MPSSNLLLDYIVYNRVAYRSICDVVTGVSVKDHARMLPCNESRLPLAFGPHLVILLNISLDDFHEEADAQTRHHPRKELTVLRLKLRRTGIVE